MKIKQLVLLFLALMTFSCNKDISSCSECQKGVVNTFNLDLRLLNTSFSKSIKYWQKDSLTVAYTSINQQDYEKIIQNLSTNEPLKDLYAIVLYLNVDFDVTNKIQPENIIAFSAYSVLNDSMYHKLFVKNINTFVPVEKYTSTVDNVRANDNNRIASMFIGSIKKSVSWIMLYSENVKPVKIKSSHQLDKLLSDNLKAGPVYCDVPCIGPGNDFCEWTPLNGYDCTSNNIDDDCLETELNTIVIDGGLNYEQSYFKYELHHQFRDDVLINTSTGQQLINDYYELSLYFIPKLTLNIAIQTYDVLPQVNSAIEKIIDKKSDVAIPTSTATQMKNLIDIYIGICDSPTILAKLNSYKNKIDNYTDIPGNQIII